MYQQFYGLDAQPFELTANPRYLLLTPTHREALSVLEYGITGRKGITLLVGEAGTGKTTLLRKALTLKLAAAGAGEFDAIFITNPSLSPCEFLERITAGLGLSESCAASKTTALRQLEKTLVDRRNAGRTTALVIDEAQCLPDGLIEELRHVTNIESDDGKLLPLVLAGQPELADRLNEHRFRQFKQRIVLRCQLSALDLQETATYIFGRVRLAGGDAAKIFTRDAIIAVYRASRGIPRSISVICDNALLAGFAMHRRRVNAEVVDEVCRDLAIVETAQSGPGEPARDASIARVTPPAEPWSQERSLAAVSASRSQR